MLYGHDITITTQPHIFGNGQHETTRFLLYFLNRYAKDRTVIDAGCGSGILSVFASKCGATVTAIESEKSAFECAVGNCKANNVKVNALHMTAEEADIEADIVVANFARESALHLLPYVDKMAKETIITTWYKQLPTEPLKQYEIIDHIEGMEYDCYVLRKDKK